jgi:indolepyruvate decarboxylase
MNKTVIEHVLSRLCDLGVRDVFGVADDPACAVNDAVRNDPNLRWVGCRNELHATYAADGYARLNGVAAVCTPYGVGEPSSLSGIAGAYAEHLPVFHLVGTPSTETQASPMAMHHRLEDGAAVCAAAVMTPQNAAHETERLIAAALYHRRPVYMAIPADLANLPVIGAAAAPAIVASDPVSLEAAVNAILTELAGARSACLLPGMLVARCGLGAIMEEFIDGSGLPFATLLLDKSVLDEEHPAYLGVYDRASMDAAVRDFVESCDQVVAVGALMPDFATIHIGHHHTRVGGQTYANVEMTDILATLAQRTPKRGWPSIEAASFRAPDGRGADTIAADAGYSRLARFIEPNDILIAEAGTVDLGLGFTRMPAGASFHHQAQRGSIEWATAAAVGAAVAVPEHRMVLFIGGRSHPLRVEAIAHLGRLGLKPIVFVLNNSGSSLESPHTPGCDEWLILRVKTCAELDTALGQASRATRAVYIEIVMELRRGPTRSAATRANSLPVRRRTQLAQAAAF